jgi:hypothetical protein
MADSTSLAKVRRYSPLASWTRRLQLFTALIYAMMLVTHGFVWIDFGLFVSAMLIAFVFPSPQTRHEVVSGQKTLLVAEDEVLMLDGTSNPTDSE